MKRAEANAKRNAELLDAIKANRAKIDANTKAIHERRAEIDKNAAAIGELVFCRLVRVHVLTVTVFLFISRQHRQDPRHGLRRLSTPSSMPFGLTALPSS